MDGERKRGVGSWLGRSLCGGVVGLAIMLSLGSDNLWAATSTAAATVNATVPARATLALVTDINSVAVSAGTVKFDKYDDVDIPGGSPSFMYAPYRSLVGKNWHLASMVANGTSLTLTAAVSGTVGPKNLADVLSVFFGGFCDGNGDCSAGKSTTWEQLSTFSRTKTGAYAGSAPLNYRLDVSGVPSSSTPFTGSVTYTLTSN